MNIMKIADNRALAAKKRNYNQPEVLVARIALASMVLAESPAPAPASGDMGLNPIETNDQW